jgi:hypothetical protein
LRQLTNSRTHFYKLFTDHLATCSTKSAQIHFSRSQRQHKAEQLLQQNHRAHHGDHRRRTDSRRGFSPGGASGVIVDGEWENRAAAAAFTTRVEAAKEAGDGGEEERVRERREAGDEGAPSASWRRPQGDSEVSGLGRVA